MGATALEDQHGWFHGFSNIDAMGPTSSSPWLLPLMIFRAVLGSTVNSTREGRCGPSSTTQGQTQHLTEGSHFTPVPGSGKAAKTHFYMEGKVVRVPLLTVRSNYAWVAEGLGLLSTLSSREGNRKRKKTGKPSEPA